MYLPFFIFYYYYDVGVDGARCGCLTKVFPASYSWLILLRNNIQDFPDRFHQIKNIFLQYQVTQRTCMKIDKQ